MKKLFHLLLVVVLLSSCSNYDEPLETIVPEQPQSVNIHTIPVDSALSFLSDFLAAEGDVDSRADRMKSISSVKTVRYDMVGSRSGDDSLKCENLLYVANFANNEGYAVMAADDRLSARVIAVTDQGYIDDKQIYKASEWYRRPQRPIVEGYPTTGPGFFTIEECGDELFINPNTVDMFIESENDTLVGNYTLDASDKVILPEVLEEYNPEDDMPFVRVVDFAINDVNNNPGNRLGNNGDGDYTVIGANCGSSGTVKETREVSYVRSKPNLLSEFVLWHQESPFNDLYPYRRNGIIIGHKQKAPAGCFPLAIAKVLTHFEYPSDYTSNGIKINWKELKRDFNSELGELSASHLLYSLAEGCKCWYFYYGTFTFPHNAANYMKFLGFQNVKSYEYTFNRITDMIDKGNPVIISSIPSNLYIWKAHCWNIDGYKVKKVTVKRDWYQGDKIVHSETKFQTYDMIHCDFGGSGNHNGYYISGIFNSKNKNNEIDWYSNGDDFNYKYNTKVILYDIP